MRSPEGEVETNTDSWVDVAADVISAGDGSTQSRQRGASQSV